MRQACALRPRTPAARLGDLACARQPVPLDGEDIARRAFSPGLCQCNVHDEIRIAPSGRVLELGIAGRLELQRQFLVAALTTRPFDITCTISGTM